MAQSSCTTDSGGTNRGLSVRRALLLHFRSPVHAVWAERPSPELSVKVVNGMTLPNPAPVSRKSGICAKSSRVRSLTCARLSSYWEVSFQCLAYFLGDPPTLTAFTLRPDRHGSLEGADKDAVTAYTFVWKGTLHEEKMPAWCIHEHDTLHKPSDYVKHRRNISCTRDDGTTGIRSTPGES